MREPITTTTTITVADLQRHAETLRRDHDIEWRQDPKMRPLRSFSVFEFECREICTPPIRSRISYAVVLHEIGHIIGRFNTSRHVMTRETWAWRWARANALLWTPAMEHSMQAALAWYRPRVARMDRKRSHRDQTLRDEHTAFHEAGHAVIARVLTLYCGGATIDPDYEEGTYGYGVIASPYSCLHQWERRGKVRGNDAVFHARILAFMAEVEAEIELLRLTQGGDDDDRYQIEEMANQLSPSLSWEQREPRLREMTRTLVRRHRALIERVAKALIKKRTLSSEELDRLVGRSVNDVKVNAPFLLEMAEYYATDQASSP